MDRLENGMEGQRAFRAMQYQSLLSIFEELRLAGFDDSGRPGIARFSGGLAVDLNPESSTYISRNMVPYSSTS